MSKYLRTEIANIDPTAGSTGSGGESVALRSHRIQYLQEQMKTTSRRDLHLWSISIVVILVLATGFAAVIAPSLAWNNANASSHFDFRYLPQLFWGMISLVLLFSLYVSSQKKELNATRRALVQEFVMSEHLQAFSLLDPVTQLLNSCALDPMVAKEIARANRLGTALTFATISLDNFQSIEKRAGIEQGEQALYHAARLLKSTFRGSDAIFRSRTSEFVVVMPDTTEQQAENAIGRLGTLTERWNAEAEAGCEFSFSWGIAGYVAGARTNDVMERARRCMFLSSQKVSFVF